MDVESEIGQSIFMLLHDAQVTFARMLPKLIKQAFLLGNEVTLGECWRTPQQVQWDVEHHIGIKHTLHPLRLAIDLNLFRNGVLLTDTKDYRELGIWWEGQSTDTYKLAWGGGFDDGDHFSLEWQGVR